MLYEILLLVFGGGVAYVALGMYGEALSEVGPHRLSLIVSIILGLFFGVVMAIVQDWLRGLGTAILFFGMTLSTFEKGKLFRFRTTEKLKWMSDEHPEIAEFYARNPITRRTMKKVRDSRSEDDSRN